MDSARVVAADGLLDAEQLETLTGALEEDPAVEYAEPDHLASITAVPDDPYYATSQWNLQPAAAGLDLPSAWDRATGRGQTIAVVDTGITSHPDLDANVAPGHDFVSLHAGGVQPGHSRDGDGWDPDPRDEGDHAGPGECGSGSAARSSSWHGTHTAGIAAARGNNGTGVAGVAHGATLLPVRALGACGDGYVSDIAVAIAWAAGEDVDAVPANPHPATVVNLSLGFLSSTCPAALQDGIDRALSRGASVVVAAGNHDRDARMESPANCRGVITVAASTAQGARAGYSNWGRVTLAAPGGDPSRQILSTADTGSARPGGGTYSYKYGTSMASPTVAGVVALVRETDPSLSPAQVKEVLAATARPLPGSCPGGCGAGLVHPRAAVARATLQEGYRTQGAIGALHARIGASTGAPRSHERCGLAQDGCYQEFERGAVYWSADSGARWVHGGVRGAWNRAGGVNGLLGYPRTGERDNGAGGVHQHFQRGTVVWSAGTGAAPVHGAVGARWAALGAETGLLGPVLEAQDELEVVPGTEPAAQVQEHEVVRPGLEGVGLPRRDADRVLHPLHDRAAGLGVEHGLVQLDRPGDALGGRAGEHDRGVALVDEGAEHPGHPPGGARLRPGLLHGERFVRGGAPGVVRGGNAGGGGGRGGRCRLLGGGRAAREREGAEGEDGAGAQQRGGQ